MKLTPLSAPEERVRDFYVQTPDGRVVDLMPELIKAGYDPLGVAGLIGRRQYAPEEVRASWETYFYTGDSSAINHQGAALLTLDSPVLRKLTSEDARFLVNGAFDVALKNGAQTAQKWWNELRADKEHSLYLSPTEVDEVHGKGYVLKDGVFVPANKTVGKIFEGTGSFLGLAHGQDVQTYAKQVREYSGGSAQVMGIYFDRSKLEQPQWRSLVLDRIDDDSDVLSGNLGDDFGRLAGERAGGASVNVAQSARVGNCNSPKAAADGVFKFLACRTLQQGMPSPKELEEIIAKSRR